LLSEKEALQKQNDDLHLKIKHVQKEKEEVQSKCRAFEKLVLKFTKGQDNLDKLLVHKECPLIKKVLVTIP